jgi:hypothetical protein
VSLDAERIRRGAAPVTVVADTERDEGRIRAGVLARREAIQECIERVLPANPEIAGRIDLAFVVETTGLIHDATGETSVAPLRAPKECIVAIVRTLRIEGVRHAATVRFPIEFENPVLEVNLSDMTLHPRMRTDAPPIAAVAVNAGAGEITANEAQALLDHHAAELLACYTPLLRTPVRRGQPRPQGSARFEVTVAPDGSVADIDRVETTDPLPAATDCIQSVLQALRFRASGRRTIVRPRFTMRPQEPTATPSL